MKLHIERAHIEALIGQFPRLADLREQLRFGNRVEVAFNQLQADELEALIARYRQGGVFLRAQAAQLHTLRQALASGGPIFDPDNLELLVPALARYLMVSRQNLAGLIGRMERQGHVCSAPDGRDRRSRLVAMTPAGRLTWERGAQAKIEDYYTQALEGFSTSDQVHALHYLLKLLDNMKQIDAEQGHASVDEGDTPMDTEHHV